MTPVTSFRQLSGEGVVGVELKEERCGEGFGRVEARRKRVMWTKVWLGLYIGEWK